MLSACLLALAFVAVLCGLAHDENWRKLLRVGLASSVYLSALLLLMRRWRRAPHARTPLPFWPFALAAAAAELSSGWLRTGVAPWMTLWLAPAAAVLVGGLHWLTLRYWRALRQRLTARAAATHAR